MCFSIFVMYILLLIDNGHEKFCCFWILMIEEKRFLLVQPFNVLHFFFRQFEIKHIEILLHAFLTDGFWNDHHITLKKETKGNLRYGLAIFFSNFLQERRVKEIIASFRKRSPRLDLALVFFQILLSHFLLLEDMGFNLVDSRFDLYEMLQINKTLR